MVRRSTWILLVILVLLIGITILYQRSRDKEGENTLTATPTTTKTKLYDLSSIELKEIRIADAEGMSIVLIRDSTLEKWLVHDSPAEQADTFEIESVIAQLLAIDIQEEIAQTPPLGTIGLATPLYTITMTKNDDTLVNTSVGSETPTGRGYYVRLDEGEVVIVEKVVMDTVIKLVSEPPLLPTETPEGTQTGTITPEGSTGGTPTP